MPDKGTVVPLPPTAKRLEEAKTLETPQSFVPGTSVSAGQSWQAAGQDTGSQTLPLPSAAGIVASASGRSIRRRAAAARKRANSSDARSARETVLSRASPEIGLFSELFIIRKTRAEARVGRRRN